MTVWIINIIPVIFLMGFILLLDYVLYEFLEDNFDYHPDLLNDIVCVIFFINIAVILTCMNIVKNSINPF